MRAVIHERYGPPEVLRVGEVERPVPEADEVLVEVLASTVTRGDAMGVRSEDYRFTRVFTGIRRPRRTHFGSEFAGRVAEVGRHDELLTRPGGVYYGLYQSQAFEPAPETNGLRPNGPEPDARAARRPAVS